MDLLPWTRADMHNMPGSVCLTVPITSCMPRRPGDGRLVVHIRNHNKANERETLQTESNDGGRTWTTPRSIGVWGLPSHLLQSADGRLLMTCGHRREPLGNQARVSSDHGRTWSGPLPISADGANADLGYPVTVQLADRSLLTVWYERMADNNRAVLRQARWPLP